MTEDPTFPPAPLDPRNQDPLELAARALLGAIAAEPVPPEIMALAEALQDALSDEVVKQPGADG